ncbi:right-handed parallel beta-helix repeat-containing protein [Flavobacteriaceae bacterium F89]|uniref:Right-handed parallel beta-helix repeat-containing protein n=1 Tax=Cerina litoralis TaxID=2874477 RepID=A0AAE3ET35_9FLAO|nr:right-handed parallel beta-helix repeat-containing protein [Cerina litoralis]MCG2459694.1 right-handed parallel beta-helix repeat-containing protein [Cerina litoralis]
MFLILGCTSDADLLQNTISVLEKSQLETQQSEKEPEASLEVAEENPVPETETSKPLNAKVISTVAELIENLKSGANLYLEAGDYKLTSTQYLTDLSNVTVTGADGAVIMGDLITLLQFRGEAKNIEFRNVGFNSTSTSKTETGGGIVYFSQTTAENILFDNCSFTCPELNANGLKFVSEGSARSKNITIINCVFLNIGRMGFETQNHTYDGIARITDVKVTDCEFQRLGLQSPYGMAVSLSGIGKSAQISKNTIVDAKDRGIENVGWSNIKIADNTFSSPSTAYAPITCSKDKVGGPQYILDVIISGNNGTILGKEDHLLEISDCNGLKFLDNNFNTDAMHLVHTINSEFNSNTHYSDGGIGIYIELNSNDNTFKGNKFVSTADNATTVVIFVGSAGNIFQNNILLAEGNDSGTFNDVDGGNTNLDVN